MTTATLTVEEVNTQNTALEMDKEAFDHAVQKARLERELLNLHHLMEQKKDLDDQVKLAKETIRDLYIDLELKGPVVAEAADGKFICAKETVTEKEVLDKEALAIELNMDVKEINKPWDFSFLTHKGKLTPEMIKNHTYNETNTDVKISRTKRNPLEKDKKNKRKRN